MKKKYLAITRSIKLLQRYSRGLIARRYVTVHRSRTGSGYSVPVNLEVLSFCDMDKGKLTKLPDSSAPLKLVYIYQMRDIMAESFCH